MVIGSFELGYEARGEIYHYGILSLTQYLIDLSYMDSDGVLPLQVGSIIVF